VSKTDSKLNLKRLSRKEEQETAILRVKSSHWNGKHDHEGLENERVKSI